MNEATYISCKLETSKDFTSLDVDIGVGTPRERKISPLVPSNSPTNFGAHPKRFL